MSTKKYYVDLQLHMAVKTLAILQGEINSKIDELVKKTNKLQEKENDVEDTDYLIELISENIGDLREFCAQRNNLRNQIKKLEKTEIDLLQK
jgi:hypothetical protein